MSTSQYHLLYTGSSIEILALRKALAEQGIAPVIKDENESARLAGFGMHSPLTQQVFVHQDEWTKAQTILEALF